jgi:AGCS family alanine or glycine:cation symporter
MKSLISRSRLSWLAILVLGVTGTVLFAQETPPKVAAAPTELLVADAPPKTLADKIDGVFAKAVSVVEVLLFHPLFQSKQDYIVYRNQIVYSRPRGTDSAFQKLGNGPGARELSDREIRIFSARGELVRGQTIAGNPQPYSWGKLDGKDVEVIKVKVPSEPLNLGKAVSQFTDGSKFVRTLREGREIFAKVGPMRGLLEQDTYLTATQVETLQKQGLIEGGEIKTESTGGIPIVVLWLAVGGVVATVYLRFVNFWGFYHAIECVGGKYDNPSEPGEVNHFQALASALSGTVGLGNIAGVTLAMSLGGPGAFFWMMLSAFFGMTLKCVECTLGVKYRLVHPDGSVLGGPMRYLKFGLEKKGWGGLGKTLAVLFTVLCILGSFGGGNMLQVNQSGAVMLQMLQQDDLELKGQLSREAREAAQREDDDALKTATDKLQVVNRDLDNLRTTFYPLYGVVMAVMVAIVILGGIKRIGKAAEIMVPGMCAIYILACAYIVLRHFSEVPAMMGLVFSEAFNPKAIQGGFLGVLVIGVKRACFSNEAGAGSAPIAHSAAKTEEPIREGIVALLEPFIDTLVVCSMTALAMLMCGAWNNSEWIVDQGLEGAALTSRAFKSEVSWFPYVLAISVVLFAYSTIISWAYYGERCWETLFGRKFTPVYKILCVAAVIVGAVSNLTAVLTFSDMMILGMAFPNVLGLYFLLGEVRGDLMTYWQKYKSGEFSEVKGPSASDVA